MPDTPGLPTDDLGKNYYDPDLQKIARAVASKWSVLRLDWQDIHMESCIRLSLRKKDAKPIDDKKRFYYMVCNNYCHETYRGMGGLIDPVELLLTTTDSKNPHKRESIISMLYQFGRPGGLLLFLFYMVEPAIKDKETLYRIAVFFGARLRGPKGIDNKMTECRQGFYSFASKHPDFEDLFT